MSDDHEPYPAEWKPLGTVFCEECGREIVTDLPHDGQPERWEHV